MNALQLKQFDDLRRGRINGMTEHAQHLRLRTNLERTLFTRVRTLIRKLGNSQAFLYREFGIFEPASAAQNMTEELFPLVSAHYRRTFLAIFELNNSFYRQTKQANIFGRDVEIERLVADYFATRQVLLSNISRRLTNQIMATIERGRAEGLNLQQIARNVSRQFASLSISRAALIARTETHNAASHANHLYHGQAADDLGITMMKTWVSTSDARTRPEHRAANGQTVGMDEPFILSHPKLGQVEMQYVADPAGGAYHSVNCRCVVVYADERDVVTT
tara:strand:+ start:1380 stop:2210 length:831 start_codon:yes stop_codon:yes gene_type:complete